MSAEDDGLQTRAGERGAEGPATSRLPVQAGPPEAEGPAYGAVRYTRRRMLILGGALAAGFAAVVAGLRAFGGSAAEKVGGAISDQFGPFPVRSVESVPDVAPEQWVVKVDGLVDSPLDRRPRDLDGPRSAMQQTVDFHCVEGWGVDDVRWGGVAPSVLLDQAGVKPEAKYAVFHAYGGVYLSTLPLDLIRDSQTHAGGLPERRAAAAQARRTPAPGRAQAAGLQERQVGGAHRAQRRGRDRVLGGERLPGGRAGPGRLSAA